MANQVLTTTAPAGHSRLQTELDRMDSDLEELKQQVKDAHESLSVCLTHCQEYETCHKAFLDWLIGVEDFLQQKPELQPSWPDKQQQLDMYKVIV